MPAVSPLFRKSVVCLWGGGCAEDSRIPLSQASLLFLISCLMASHVIMFYHIPSPVVLPKDAAEGLKCFPLATDKTNSSGETGRRPRNRHWTGQHRLWQCQLLIFAETLKFCSFLTISFSYSTLLSLTKFDVLYTLFVLALTKAVMVSIKLKRPIK